MPNLEQYNDARERRQGSNPLGIHSISLQPWVRFGSVRDLWKNRNWKRVKKMKEGRITEQQRRIEFVSSRRLSIRIIVSSQHQSTKATKFRQKKFERWVTRRSKSKVKKERSKKKGQKKKGQKRKVKKERSKKKGQKRKVKKQRSKNKGQKSKVKKERSKN